MPAVPAMPPARTAVGEKDAATSMGSGPPLTKTAIAVMTRESSSSVSSTPSTLAPTSTESTERMSTSAHAMNTQIHQGQSMPNCAFICPAMTAPKNPKIASWMAKYATSDTNAEPTPVLMPRPRPT